MRFWTIMISLFLIFTSGFCDENRSSVDEQIAQMEKALESDRAKLIAELKAMIVQINAKEHSVAIGMQQKRTHKDINNTQDVLPYECQPPKK